MLVGQLSIHVVSKLYPQAVERDKSSDIGTVNRSQGNSKVYFVGKCNLALSNAVGSVRASAIFLIRAFST
jgi:hypothetical protein